MSNRTAFLKACLALALVTVLAAAGVRAEPMTVAPGNIQTQDFFYVFGPGGSKRAGAEDGLQVVFVRVPASAGQVTLSIFDPGSGTDLEKRSMLWSTAPETTFKVLGGSGAVSAPGSATVRPTADQPGTVLAETSFKTDNQGVWVDLGTFPASAGEVVGDQAYFKIVARGISGSGPNFFKVGVNNSNAAIFTYDATVHLVPPLDETMRFYVEAPAGDNVILENNYDVDDGANLYWLGKRLERSTTGKWVGNRLEVPPHQNRARIEYRLNRDRQIHANAGFHFTDAQGNALKMFFVGVPLAVPAPSGCDEVESDYVLLRKCVPAEVVVGQEVNMSITVSPRVDVVDVVVKDIMPDGMDLVSSEPKAEVNGNVLTWHFDRINASMGKEIVIVGRATREGQYVNCATVEATPALCVTTAVGKPVLEIAKTGPAQVLLGENIPYTVTVTNTGTSVARNVVVTDVVPDGLSHDSGNQRIAYNVGDLAPGAKRELPLVLKADKRGRFCNRALAKADNTDQVQADACTLVVQRGLTIEKTASTDVQFVPKTAGYMIVVTNTGDIPLEGVVVTDIAPDGTTVVAAPGGNVNGQVVTWQLGTVPAGESKKLAVTLRGNQVGERCNVARVTCAAGLSAEDDACTVWKGYPALLIEMVDDPDPLLPNEETTYTITVTNQGFAPDNNVRLTMTCPPQLSIVRADGATRPTVQGQTVTTAPYPTLQPKQAVTWTVRCRAEKTGDARFKVALQSELLKDPVVEEESTQVY